MNPIARSPFGPAAEQHCNIKAHAELALLDENVKNLSKALVEEYRKETAKYQHLAEMERTRAARPRLGQGPTPK